MTWLFWCQTIHLSERAAKGFTFEGFKPVFTAIGLWQHIFLCRKLRTPFGECSNLEEK